MSEGQMDDERYLWDRSGEPDAEIVRLEALLSPLRHRGQPLGVRPRPPVRRWVRMLVPALAVAAMMFLVASAAWFSWTARRDGWDVQRVGGAPVVSGVRVAGNRGRDGARLAVGGWLVTDGASRARIEVGEIGEVEVDPNTRLQLVTSSGREHRMALARGTIHATIWAPPKFFFVDTPSAVAVDLGCAYTLQVADDGSGMVRVTHGWVGFQSGAREVFIPEGAVCSTRRGNGPGTPRYEDAPAGYAGALAVLDFSDAGDARRASALDVVLSRARPRDALTLWHLLRRGSLDERRLVYERMAVLAPPPDGVTREAVLAGDRAALDRWWDALGLESTTWWRLWKRDWEK